MGKEKTRTEEGLSFGLWGKTSKKGAAYWGGMTDRYWVSLLPNYSKRTDSAPDFTLLYRPKEGEEDLEELRAGLWLRVAKSTGIKYLGGSLGDYYVSVFKSKSNHPKAPDYNVVMTKRTITAHPARTLTPQAAQQPERDVVRMDNSEGIAQEARGFEDFEDVDDIPF